MTCQADRCKYLEFSACERPAALEVSGSWSTFLLCRDCKERLIASGRSDGAGWTIKRLASPVRLSLVFLASGALALAIAFSGCGDVSAAADVAGAAGAAGAAGEIGGQSGLPGDGGHGGIAPMPNGGTGGAAGADQAQGGMGGAPATGGAGAPGTDAGQSSAVCPHVVSYAIAVSSHCFQGCRTSAGAIAGSCELSAADAAGWKPYSAPLFCVPTAGALPADCR
jgi:hypothetical protein